MDHGAVIRSNAAGMRRIATAVMLLGLALALAPNAHAADAVPATTAATPATTPAVGAKLVVPADGHHFDDLERAPMVQLDPSKDAAGKQETPKWVLLATDPAMKTTVRYCRQFVWAMDQGAYHWGCNRWATGADQYGGDVLLALEPGTVYYWQVVSSTADGKGEVKSGIRSFAIDPEGKANTVQDVSKQVVGTALDDGSQLNLGAAALVNSGVRVTKIASSKLATYAFRINASHVGTVDTSRSYIKVTSAAGTRYLKVARVGTGGAVGTVWKLTAAERRLRVKRFTYQAYLKSTKNGSMVRSQLRVVLIRTPKAAPRWTPDR
ncbi:MAG: hypothetical protein JWM86_609 [Thermoleophilia bacterium]|nr:hypothetical protein [Thermoleophilia bacterium]